MKIDNNDNPFPLRRALLAVLAGLLILVLFGYVLYQARFLILGPQITLLEHPAPEQYSRVVILEGTMFNIVAATLNGRTIYTDETGYFEEALILENGYTIATLEAEDRYGRQTSIQKEFVFTPQSLVTNE